MPLLILRIPLYLSPDAGYKYNRFLKTLLKKGLEFVLSKRDGTVAFNLSFVLLLVEVTLILEKQVYKKDALKTCDIGRVKIIFLISTKIVAFHIRATIVHIRVLGLKSSI